MSDILQDSSGDISIIGNSLVIVTGIEEIRQRITHRLRTFYGEWFLEMTKGVKYFQEILRKNPNATLRDNMLREEILKSPGVIGLENYTFSVDDSTRVGTLIFVAQTIEGNIVAEVTIP